MTGKSNSLIFGCDRTVLHISCIRTTSDGESYVDREIRCADHQHLSSSALLQMSPTRRNSPEGIAMLTLKQQACITPLMRHRHLINKKEKPALPQSIVGLEGHAELSADLVAE